ncbi:MAG: FHA domain-containing protein [Planctomycetota bacterium]|jgi:predicted component of type VI protein secretion system
MPYLVWESPGGRVVHPLQRTVTIIGSDPINDIRLDDPTVERRHALIERDGEKVTITDLNSKTGTRINGAQLMPDVPATLDPGDFLSVGGLDLMCLRTPPPITSREAAAAAVAEAPSEIWKWITLGLAFVVVGLLGALIAVLAGKPEVVVVEEDPAVTGREKAPAAVPADKPDPPAEPESRPEMPAPVEPEPKEAGPRRAAAGALPPNMFASLATCPDLLELAGERYAPARLEDWDSNRIVAVGSDGLLYTLARSKVTKIEDRADLARRAEREREKLAPEDADGKLALAAWCARRHIRDHAASLAREVLSIRPKDPAARTLLQSIGEAE